jgi:hypothetical protein
LTERLDHADALVVNLSILLCIVTASVCSTFSPVFGVNGTTRAACLLSTYRYKAEAEAAKIQTSHDGQADGSFHDSSKKTARKLILVRLLVSGIKGLTSVIADHAPKAITHTEMKVIHDYQDPSTMHPCSNPLSCPYLWSSYSTSSVVK